MQESSVLDELLASGVVFCFVELEQMGGGGQHICRSAVISFTEYKSFFCIGVRGVLVKQRTREKCTLFYEPRLMRTNWRTRRLESLFLPLYKYNTGTAVGNSAKHY